MRHLTARPRGDEGWHYVSMGRGGGYPLGYCADHAPHATEAEARECYAQYQRDNIRLDGKTLNWHGCCVCDAPTKNFADIKFEGFRGASLCDEHLTHEHAVVALNLDKPSGDAWRS